MTILAAAVGTDGWLYRLMVLAHIIAVIIGFGGVMLNEAYSRFAKKRGGEAGLAVLEANAWVSNKHAAIAMYLIPVFGFAAVGFSEKVFRVSQTWVWLSALAWLAGLAVAHSTVIPMQKKINGLYRQAVESGNESADSPEMQQIAQLEKRMAMAGPILGLLFMLAMVLMIWKPGL